ncbi:hypothetical protein [Acinetobacter baumannii]|uniref:hypothetical protein n=1 Tax=Acinetobacter baumannii TaxID=470 RepID=UPI00070829F5|nr:hypothetical protein [Acinetobacter baumannii]KQD41165.1 hypothetical protein APD15_10505 [Acinetobacter baumannii]KQD42468.1 hypothetical protein APD15_04190 [Acinetobacter baumannii]OTK98884.1 hypothetical protein B9X84_09900 [Acinetobacter baumannii]
MHISISIDLNGEVVNNSVGTFFEASEKDSSKQSTYNRQSYIVEWQTYRFWLCAERPYAETTKIDNKYLAEKYPYLS